MLNINQTQQDLQDGTIDLETAQAVLNDADSQKIPSAILVGVGIVGIGVAFVF